MSSFNLEVKSRFHDYKVFFLPNLERCLHFSSERKTFYLVDRRVYDLYEGSFQGVDHENMILQDATELNKTFSEIEVIFNQLIDVGFKKNSRLVVVGGGILQDIGGFVSTVLFRGVEWDLVPTTLLAQVDSCIGSKTSVNLKRGKNLLGSFYPPKNVLLTSSVLKTLSMPEIWSGLCEAIKLAIVDSPQEMKWLSTNIEMASEMKGLDEIIYRALKIKKKYIEEDEMDTGRRNLLNFGHTFGHAFESLSDYQIPHGIAVGMGIQAAYFFSHKMGMISKEERDAVISLFDPLTKSYERHLVDCSADHFLNVMKRDKKNTDSNITFVLSRGAGSLEKHKLAPDIARDYLEEFFVFRGARDFEN